MTDGKQGQDEPEKDITQPEETKSIEDTITDSKPKTVKIGDQAELYAGEPKSDKSDLDLEVEKPKKSESAKEVAEKQKQAWLVKILKGEATIEDLPKNLKWLELPLLKEIKAIEKATDVDTEAKLEKIIETREEKREFDKLKKQLDEANLTSEQKQQVSEEFKDLVKAGVPELKALEKAIRITGIQLDVASAELKKSMHLPSGGGKIEEPDYDNPEDILKITSSKERTKYWERMAKGGRQFGPTPQ